MRMWIDGKCFNIKNFEKHKKHITALTTKTSTEGNASHLLLEHTHSINEYEDNKLATSFRLPSFYYIHMNKKPNFCIKTLEKQTNTKVLIPKFGNEGCITIVGNNEVDIISATEHIHSVVGDIRNRTRAAQFICIPVHTEEVQNNFEKFKQEILNGELQCGIDESIFQKSIKLHLTLSVFALMDNTEKEEAISALNECKSKIIEPFITETGAIKIRLEGIDCMNNNHSKVNVLYAKARIETDAEGNILQTLANAISTFFYERGLVCQHQENVKLHVTLMNTKYRKSSSPRNKFKRQPFDARTIMENYRNFYFGQSLLDSVHLSLMSTQREDGFYKPLSIIEF